jgi:dUTPase
VCRLFSANPAISQVTQKWKQHEHAAIGKQSSPNVSWPACHVNLVSDPGNAPEMLTSIINSMTLVDNEWPEKIRVITSKNSLSMPVIANLMRVQVKHLIQKHRFLRLFNINSLNFD